MSPRTRFHAQLGLHLLAEEIGKRAGAGELDVAMRVLFRLPHELADDGLALVVVNALGDSDDAAPVTLESFLDVGEELVDDEGALRQIERRLGPSSGYFRASAEAAVRKPACRPITTAT